MVGNRLRSFLVTSDTCDGALLKVNPEARRFGEELKNRRDDLHVRQGWLEENHRIVCINGSPRDTTMETQISEEATTSGPMEIAWSESMGRIKSAGDRGSP